MGGAKGGPAGSFMNPGTCYYSLEFVPWQSPPLAQSNETKHKIVSLFYFTIATSSLVISSLYFRDRSVTRYVFGKNDLVLG